MSASTSHSFFACILLAVICGVMAGCGKSGALDTLAVENAKIRAENDLLRAENRRLTDDLDRKTKAEDERSRKDTCMKNLRRIGETVEFWALENRKAGSDQPTAGDLARYVKVSALVCPSGGLYSLGTPDASPSCTIHGSPMGP